MKKFLKFAGIISAVLAITAFIFMMAGNALVYKASESTTYTVSGIRALFGGQEQGLLGTIEIKPAPTALIGWILVLVAILILVVGIVLPLLKVHALDKVAGILNLVAVCALVVGGILLFFTKPAFGGANDTSAFDDYKLSFAFVFAGILAISGGVIAILPAAVDFIGKKK